MRHCFYHTDLGQNAAFHNFAIQIALIQYSGRSKHAWAFNSSPEHVVSWSRGRGTRGSGSIRLPNVRNFLTSGRACAEDIFNTVHAQK